MFKPTQTRFPSVRTLARIGLTGAEANTVRNAMRAGRGLHVCDTILSERAQSHGIESFIIPDNSPSPEHVCEYVNRGDTYVDTLLLVDGTYVVDNFSRTCYLAMSGRLRQA